MGGARTYRITSSRVAIIVGSTLALWFVVAFTTKAVDAYRLRTWRDQLQGEIVAMERERDELRLELARRQTWAWVDERLRDAGMVPEGVVSVIAVPISEATPASAEAAPAEGALSAAGDGSTGGSAFDNANWEAWQRLIWGFDSLR